MPKRYWKTSNKRNRDWTENNQNPRVVRPPGLRGKEIGLFYRDLNRHNKQNKGLEYTINLRVPNSVVKRVRVLLQSIAKTDEGLKSREEYANSILYRKLNKLESHISPQTQLNNLDHDSDEYKKLDVFKSATKVTESNLHSTKSSCSPTTNLNKINIVKNEEDDFNVFKSHSDQMDVVEVQNEMTFHSTPSTKCIPLKYRDKCSKSSIKKEATSKSGTTSPGPSTSSAPDFIPLYNKHEFKHDYIKFKYDYYDVITTSFHKKLDECLTKDIPVKLSGEEHFSESKNMTLKATHINEDQFKYDYYDIISGSFEEKLNESLAAGITINHSNREIERQNLKYFDEFKDMTSKSKYKEMLEFRKKLPAFKITKDLLEIVNNNQVIVISGETGCGKSTQVPQILLDDAVCCQKGANFKILVTQPRRIAASSLALRVAEERAEKPGKTVGYMVRLESILARSTGSIMFCTTGILLAELEVNQGLTSYSHIILDEVHERDSHVDLAMCMLRQIIKKRKDLKLILMSATLDADRLCEYFDNCSRMHIEGLAYPVKDIFLEEILQLTGYTLPPKTEKRYRKDPSEEMQKDIKHKADVGPCLEPIRHTLAPKIYNTLLDYRIDELNVDLIIELLKYICRGAPGAILVFLPGISDITSLIKKMEESNVFPSNRYEVHPVHSKLPSIQQNKIFVRPPNHIRKIVIATNIAETSITIDDIVYVVDSAKIKVKGLNIENNVTTLQTEWVAQSNLRQRRGRAGRVQPGICYHLLPTYQAQKLPEQLLPELQRSDLLEAVLTVKRLRLGKAADALSMVPDPPALTTIQAAVRHLSLCGALDSNETLTPLGWHLARLPAHPAAGKLLILGALFGCLDRAASVAAVWGFKDPFMLVIGKEDQVKQAKRDLALGEPSDHVAIAEAIISWERFGNGRRSFAYEYFLSNNTLELLSDMKRQFGNSLKQMGFLPSGDIKSTWENRNSSNLSLFKAIIAASLYPNIGSVRWKGTRKSCQTPRVIVSTPEDGKVTLHPSSVMAVPPGRNGRLLCTPGANWLTYWLKQKSSQLFLIDVTLVYTMPLLFFGVLNFEDVIDSPNDCHITFSNVKVRCDRETINLLMELRFLLDKVLATKVGTGNDRSIRNKFEEYVLNAVTEIITAEDEKVEYISDDDDDPSGSDFSDSDRRQKH